MLSLLFTGIIVAVIAGLLVIGFSVFLSADNGTDFYDPQETRQALAGCGIILVALAIIAAFVYSAVS